MNINNIKEGQVIKNYRELCTLLGIKVVGGASKQAQLKEFNRYFEYHKDGNKFVIDKIYSEPLVKIIQGNNSKYVNDIEDILITYIYQKKNKEGQVRVSLSQLIRILGIVNENFIKCKNRRKEIEQLLEITPEAVYYFYMNTTSEFKNIVDRALKSLKGRFVIEFHDEYKIIKNKQIYKIADNIETNKILDVQNQALVELKLKNKKELFLSSMNTKKKFKELVMKRLPSDWKGFYKEYVINAGENAIKNEYINVTKRRKGLNVKIIERVTKILCAVPSSPEQSLIDNLISLEKYSSEFYSNIEALHKQNKDKLLQLQSEDMNKISELKQDIENKKKQFESANIDDTDIYSYGLQIKKRKINQFNKDDDMWGDIF